MCYNFENTNMTEFIGYKVVFKNLKTKEYHSALTGNKYPTNRKMPIWKIQRSTLTSYFIEDLLYKNSGHWNIEMQGRTAAFCCLSDAMEFKDDINFYSTSVSKAIIVQVKLIQDLLKAKFNGSFVFAGRKMKILKEIN